VAHTCNPSYSGCRDQEIEVGRQPRQMVHETLSRKTLHKNRAGGVPQGEVPEFKPQYHKKKTKQELGGVAQAIELLPSNFKTVSSNPSTTKNFLNRKNLIV
jgi:hypothetical protein